MRGTCGVALFCSAFWVQGPAFAQANSNAIVGANDAFGFRQGDETVGIYDETSARGFSLEAAGNYRFHGTYFVKNSGVSSFFLDSTTVRIGFNTLPVAFPSPSGIVDYTLRDPARDEPSLLTVGMDYFSQPYAEVLLKHRSSTAPLSGAIGVSFVSQATDRQGGSSGGSVLIGGTARYSPGPLDLRIFGGEYRYEKPSQFRLITEAGFLNRRMKRDRFIGIEGLNDQGQRRIAGLLADVAVGKQIGIGTTTVFTQEDPSRSSLLLFDGLANDESVNATIISTPAQRTTSISSELRAYWSSNDDPEDAHRIDAVARFRRTRSSFGGSTVYDLGRVQFDEKLERDRASFAPRGEANLDDHIRQVGAGLAYRGVVGPVRLNAGMLRTSYRKEVGGDAIGKSELQTAAWIYNLSAAYELSKWLTVYGGYSRGLEEAGVAPASAPNRYEVLPPAKARQYEVSVIVRPLPDFKIVIGAFDLQRGYFGADGIDGSYRKLGQVRHRGIELSAAGKVAKGLTAIIGGVLLDPIVKASIGGENENFRPIGVPKLKLQASADYEFLPAIHADATVQFTSNKPATLNSGALDAVSVPSSWTVSAGLRAPVKLAGMNSTVRLQAWNLLNDYGWEPSSAGTMNYSTSRCFRMVLTSEF